MTVRFTVERDTGRATVAADVL
jgi:hypothetical protein